MNLMNHVGCDYLSLTVSAPTRYLEVEASKEHYAASLGSNVAKVFVKVFR